MLVQDKLHAELEEILDSIKMMLSLAASQQYVKYTRFLTFTASKI